MTPSERRLWQMLRDRRFRGFKFRPQHPVGPYLADFYCTAQRLVVEVDGKVHADDEVRAHDAGRDDWLRARGVRIVRLPADMVMRDMNQALYRIAAAMEPAEHP